MRLDAGPPRQTRLRFRALLSGLACVCSISAAQSWRIEPTLQTNVLVTDNSHIGTNLAPARDAIVGLTPGLRFTGRGGRVRVDGDLSLQVLEYAKDTLDDSVFARGKLAVGVDVVEQWVHVDASVSADQSGADPFSLQQGANVSAEDLTTRRYRISPHIERQLSSTLTFLARSDNLWTRRSGDASLALPRKDSRVQQNVVRVERRPVPFGASLEVTNQRSKFPDDSEAALDLDAVRATATYAPVPELVLGVSAGRERSRFALNNDTDSVYGGSLSWRPTERSDFSGNVEHRFFGWGGTAELRHRSPFLAISVRLERGPIVQPSSLLLATAGGDVAALLDAAFTTRYPNPAERDVIVRNLISSQGLPTVLSGPVDVFPDYVQLRHLASINASFLGKNTTVAVGAYAGRATQLLREDSPYVPSPATDSDNRQYGLTFDVNRRITPVTTVSAKLSESRIDGLGSRLGDSSRETALTLSVNYALSPRTTMVGGVRRRLFDSTVIASSQESAAFLGTNHRF
jgi:uncharacterized protein (PEP-CTERM system associated)